MSNFFPTRSAADCTPPARDEEYRQLRLPLFDPEANDDSEASQMQHVPTDDAPPSTDGAAARPVDRRV
jgi:hypothetical protein